MKQSISRYLLPPLLGLGIFLFPNPAMAGVITHQLSPSDSLAQLASFVGVDTALVAAMNNLKPQQSLPESGTLYLPQQEQAVRLGDWGSLEQIATAFRVNATEIINYNDLGDLASIPADTIIDLPPSISGQNQAVATVASRLGSRQVLKPQPKEEPWQLPLKEYVISSPFGERHGGFHHGIDLAIEEGTVIHAARAGEIIFAGWKNDIYGYMVSIDHGDGFVSNYAHCSLILVEVGDQVKSGQNIATIGETGDATGPHLHFEIKLNGDIVDPNDYLSFE